ncbi:MAG: U32 family peptidase [Faecalibacterium sp.]|nr:U32 family peptidase [Faecalibacterium sp.]
MNTIEILAPVGSEEMLAAAVYSGADAVYLGFSGYNARSGAGNFTAETLQKAVAFCHGRGVHVHVALNTTVYGHELAGLADAVRAVAQSGADAVICQDLATAALVRRIAPGLPLHGSTQMSVHTLAGAKQLAEMGFARAILARELNFAEIEHITKHCGIETEVFVHGALCMSVSGQCYMSAFLGGRSGNRGSCAGPCRLPFDASPIPEGLPGRAHHLSLKDNSVIDWLPKLQAAGVASVKIEGRLRTPEYVAAAVNACAAARSGLAYDRDLLQKAFSRSGFTDGYLSGRIDGSMFGTRSEADAEATKKALPALRELYRRERQRVPVAMKLEVEEYGAKLTVTDTEGNKAIAYGDADPQPANNDPAPALRRSLEKCGGTPFLPNNIEVEMDGGPWYLPGSCINEMRRTALEALLKKRETIRPHKLTGWQLPADIAVHKHPMPAAKPLRARFADWQQVPEEAIAGLEYLILPIEQADAVPPHYRAKTILELPRVMFGRLEEDTVRRIAVTAQQGFAGYEANNIGHFQLLQGLPVFGGLGLNLTNPLAAQEYAALGAKGLLLLPEVKDSDMPCIAPVGTATGAMVYGHMPLMLTRACPLHNLHTCARCEKQGELTDRKAKKFPVRCGQGVRTIYNPIPIYMGDKPAALAVDWEYAHFSIETKQQAAEILALLKQHAPFEGDFTRGLYFKGTA